MQPVDEPGPPSEPMRPVHMPGGLEGQLCVPPSARGVVVFAHGSGSSRHSPRNQHVAGLLRAHNLATLLMDLLTPQEEALDRQSGKLRFQIDLLAERVGSAAAWLELEPTTANLKMGCFGASTGAAAALLAAAALPKRFAAIVSRGGRPDLAGAALKRVQAATLLIVGGNDTTVLALNRQALAQLRAPKDLVIVPGASHLFEEPGALDNVAQLASRWFVRHLDPTPESHDQPQSENRL
jgi:putative phosphoribosyl transferase